VSNHDRSTPRALPLAGHRPTPATSGSVTTASVTDDIEQLAQADQALAGGLDEIVASRVRVCPATVDRLEDLLEIVRGGVRVRGRLQRLDPELLRAAGELWLTRRATHHPQRGVHVAH